MTPEQWTPEQLAELFRPAPWPDAMMEANLRLYETIEDGDGRDFLRKVIAEQVQLRLRRDARISPSVLAWIAKDWSAGRTPPRRSPTEHRRILAAVYAMRTLFGMTQRDACDHVADAFSKAPKTIESVIQRNPDADLHLKQMKVEPD